MPSRSSRALDDIMCDVCGGRATAADIPGAELVLIEGLGHNLPSGAWPEIGLPGSSSVSRRFGNAAHSSVSRLDQTVGTHAFGIGSISSKLPDCKTAALARGRHFGLLVWRPRGSERRRAPTRPARSEGDSCLCGRVADRLDVVAVGIKHIPAVVVGVVDLAHRWCAVSGPASTAAA